jgi:hypothetical protein
VLPPGSSGCPLCFINELKIRIVGELNNSVADHCNHGQTKSREVGAHREGSKVKIWYQRLTRCLGNVAWLKPKKSQGGSDGTKLKQPD